MCVGSTHECLKIDNFKLHSTPTACATAKENYERILEEEKVQGTNLTEAALKSRSDLKLESEQKIRICKNIKNYF